MESKFWGEQLFLVLGADCNIGKIAAMILSLILAAIIFTIFAGRLGIGLIVYAVISPWMFNISDTDGVLRLAALDSAIVMGMLVIFAILYEIENEEDDLMC